MWSAKLFHSAQLGRCRGFRELWQVLLIVSYQSLNPGTFYREPGLDNLGEMAAVFTCPNTQEGAQERC